MRDFFAILAIIAAVIGLGVFRVPDDNALVAAGIKVAAQGALLDVRHPITLEVKGREVTASGRVESEVARAHVVQALAGVDGVEEVVDALTLLPDVSPFTLSINKADELSAQGYAPELSLIQGLEQRFDVEFPLTVATGAPDRDWAKVVDLGAQALDLMLDGRLELRDRALSLRGRVHLPSTQRAIAAMFEALPDGYKADLRIRAVDDGLPYSLQLSRDSRMGLRLSGKVPPDFDMALLEPLGADHGRQIARAPMNLEDEGFVPALQVALPLFAQLAQGSLSVTPGVVTFSGGPAGQELLDQVAGLQGALPLGYALHNALVPEAGETPLALSVSRDGSGVAVQGHVPRDFDLARLKQAGLEGAAVELTRSPYPDLSGWSDGLWPALKALKVLEQGRVELGDQGVSVTGTAANPIARVAAMRALKGRGTLEAQLLDDGTPPAFTLSYSATTGLQLVGKLPAGLAPRDLAQGLGFDQIRANVTSSTEGSAGLSLSALEKLKPGLDLVEGFTLSLKDGQVAVEVQITPGVDPKAWKKHHRLWGMVVGEAPSPLNGTRRMHLVTEAAQVAVAGYWLPELSGLDAESCAARAQAFEQIAFPEGEFQIPVEAHWSVARLAALIRGCARMGLRAALEVVSGASRLEVFNAQVARRRAYVLQEALLARGVRGDVLEVRSGAGARDMMRLQFMR